MDRLTCDRMFLAVVEGGSFARAAERLGTSTGQASKLVSRLEAELGVRLLHRTTRALSPTEAGQAYFQRLRPLMEEWDALDAETRDRSGAPRGTVRLTAPLSFGTLRLAPILTRFALAHPQVGLDVRLTDRVVNLVDEGFDLAVRIGRPTDSTLVARRLGTARIVALASPGYLDGRGAPERPEDLTAHDCIVDVNFRDPFVWTFAGRVAVPIGGRLSFSDATLCLRAAEAGLGVAYMPEFVALEAIEAGRVVRVLEGFEGDPIPIHAMTPSGRHQPAKVRVLVEALAAGLREKELLPDRKE